VKGFKQPWLAYTYVLFVVIIGQFLLLQLFYAIRINKFSRSIDKQMKEKVRKEKQNAKYNRRVSAPTQSTQEKNKKKTIDNFE